MKRIALAALLLMAAGPALAQRYLPGDGGGIVGGGSGGSVSSNPNTQTFTKVFNWANVATTSSTSEWTVTQTTANGVSVTTGVGPGCGFSFTTSGRRARWWEAGMAQTMLPSCTRNSEYKLIGQFTGFNVMGGAGGELFQLCVGDTASYQATKKPTGFGVICGAEAAAFASGHLPNTWIGYVCTGADSTYIPLAAPTANDKIYIHANANNGSVDFYINGVLKGSISSPVRLTTVDTRGLSLWFTGDTTDTPSVYIGPLVMERAW